MGIKRTRLQNMMEANKRLLKEDHEHTDEGKMDYIKGALKNLSPNDLDEVYLMVEGLDSEYKPNITKGNYSRSDVNF